MAFSATGGFDRLLRKLDEPTHLGQDERNELSRRGVELLRLSGLKADGDYYVLDIRQPGDDFCCVCGQVAPKEKFRAQGRCPNSLCPRPDDWND